MSALILPLAHPNQFASPFFLIASLLMFFAAVAIVPGLVGWYAYQSARAGWLGFVGFSLVFFLGSWCLALVLDSLQLPSFRG